MCIIYFNERSNKATTKAACVFILNFSGTIFWFFIIVLRQHFKKQKQKRTITCPLLQLIKRAQKTESCSLGAKNSTSLTVAPAAHIWHFTLITVFQVGERPSGQMAQWLTQLFEPLGHQYLCFLNHIFQTTGLSLSARHLSGACDGAKDSPELPASPISYRPATGSEQTNKFKCTIPRRKCWLLLCFISNCKR